MKKTAVSLPVIKSALDHKLCAALDPHHFQAIRNSTLGAVDKSKRLTYRVFTRTGVVFEQIAADSTKVEETAKKLVESIKKHFAPKKKAAVKLS